ncbi:hypothetical protein HDV02_003502 [Globomyces sp. JEL0801]|nr:hypothetical protein HDV02_003502 [Globomyces sp. JEL0801]
MSSLTVETGELLLHPENSNRVFVFKVFPTYPLGGLQSVRVIGIEPMMFDEEVDVWNDKLDKMSITSILELLPSLN